jgi:hypothetical protein
MEIVIRVSFILIFAIRMDAVGQVMKPLTLDSIVLGSHISMYDDFQVVDKLPEKSIPESYLPKRADRFYYLTSSTYSYLDQEVKNFIVTADSLGRILSLDIVLAFDNTILDKMISKYGQWAVASSLGHGAEQLSSDLNNQSLYVWRYTEDSLISMMLNRYQKPFSEDTIVVTYSRKKK